MSSKPKLKCYYYAARKCPVDSWYVIKRSRALKWYLEYIIKSTERFAEALQDDIYGKRYYLQRIKWEDVDLLTAFDVPFIDARIIGVEFNLVVPQLIDNGNGTQSVTPTKTDTGGLTKVTKHLITKKAYVVVE